MRLAGLVFVGAWLSVAGGPQVASSAVEAEVYRVALAAMRFEPLGSTLNKHALMATTFDPGGWWRGLDAETVRNFPYLHPRRRLTYVKPETVEAFLRAIETQRPLPKELGRLPAFLVVQAREARAITARDGWRAFEQRHALAPGTVAVSRIGFDRSGSQALLAVSFVCGMLCGTESYVLLEREGAAWQVVKIDGYAES